MKTYLAAFIDCIERLKFYRTQYERQPDPFKCITIDNDDGMAPQALAALLEDAGGCTIEDGYIEIQARKTSKELEAEAEANRKDCLVGHRYWLRWLRERAEKPEYKEQVEELLERLGPWERDPQ